MASNISNVKTNTVSDDSNIETGCTQSKSAVRRAERGKGAYETIHQKPKMQRMGVNESYAKRRNRQLNRQAIKEEIASTQVQAQFDYQNKITLREHNKMERAKRLHIHCLKDISQYLSPQFNMNLTAEERLIHYSKSHKCKHNRAYNIIEMIQCSCEEPLYYYKVSCDHEREHIIPDRPIAKCRRCARVTTLLERNCYCSASYCSWCRFSTYSLQLGDEYVTRVVCVCGRTIINKPIPNIIVTKSRRKQKKMWKTPKSVQTAPILSIQDFPPLTTAHSGSMRPDTPIIHLNPSPTVHVPCIICGIGELPVEHPVHSLCQANPFHCICQIEDQTQDPMYATCMPCSIMHQSGIPQPCCGMYQVTPFLSSFLAPLSHQGKLYILQALREYMRYTPHDSVKTTIYNYLTYTSAHSGRMKPLFVKDAQGRDTSQLIFPNRLAYYMLVAEAQADGTIVNNVKAVVMGKNATVRANRLRQLEEWYKTATTPHGGAMSVAKDTFSSIGTSILEMGKKCIEFVKSMFSAALDTTQDWYKRARLHLKTCYVLTRINQVMAYLKANPMSVTALVGTLISAFTSENRIAQLASVTSALILLWSIIKSGPINKQDLVREAAEQGEGEVNNPDEVFHDADNELENLFGLMEKQKDNTAHGIEDYLPNLIEKFTAFFGFTTSVMQRAWPFAANSFKVFMTVMVLRKGLGEFFEYFAKFLPDWVRALTIAGNSKLLIRTHILDEASPLGKAYRSALAVKLAAEDGLEIDEVLPIKEEAAQDYRDWLRYIKEKLIPLDNDITKMNTILEEYGNTVCKAKARKHEPFMIRFSGASGVGKSTVWPIIMSYLPGFQECRTKEEINALVYTRCITDDFWSGYNNTYKCVRYDDFAQQRDEKDLMEIIGLGGEAPFMPAMPSINPKDEKIGVKGTMVTVDYVMMLSNTNELRPSTLNCAEAINRRRHVHITFDFKPGMKTREPDFSHMQIKLQYTRHQQAPAGLVFADIAEVASFIRHEHELFLESQKEVSASIDDMLFNNTVPKSLDRIKTVTSDVQKLKSTIKRLNEDEKKIEEAIKQGGDLSKIKSDLTITEAHVGESKEQDKEDLLGIRKPESTTGKYWTLDYYKKLASNFVKSIQSKGYSIWCKTSEWAAKLKDVTYSFVVRVIQVTSDVIYMAAVGALAGMLTIVGTVKLLSFLYPPPSENEPHSGTTKTARYTPIKMAAHGGNADDVARLLHQNVVRICCPTKNAEQCGYFVSGSTILLNEHFFLSSDPYGDRYIADGTELFFYTETSKLPERFIFKKDSLEVIQNNSGGFKDAVLYRLPDTIMKRRSLVNHFWDGTTDLRNRKVMHIQIDKRGDPKTTVCSVSGDENYTRYDLNFNGQMKEVCVVDAFYYDYRSINGDCGSPIMCVDDSMVRKILGFHVSGSDAFGYSVGVMITQTMLEKALIKLDERTGVEIIRQTTPHTLIIPADRSDVLKSNLDGKLHVYGMINKHMSPSMKSTIKPSPLFDLIGEHATIPAHLNFSKLWKDEGIDLLRKGANKYSPESVTIDSELVAQVQESMASDLFAKMDTVTPRRVLTLHEAINGAADYPFMTGLNMSTSPGFPWVMDPKFRGAKRNLFVMTEFGYEPLPVLLTAINDTLVEMKKGIIPELPYIDALKDERRPILKVQQHKTRMFSICPLVMTIIGRMYQLSFLSHMMQKRCTIWSMIGINKNSTEWQAMWNHLSRMGVENAFDGDYEQYDGTLNKQLAMIHFWLCRRFYQLYDQQWTITDDVVRQVIMYFNCEAMHAMYCVVLTILIVYISNGGNPSGQDGTTPTNTNANEAAMRMAWIKLAPVNMKDLYYYIRLVSNAIYGDDIVTSVRTPAKTFFGPDKIQKAMAEIGMKYGPADKLSTTGHFNHLKDCTFLKNSTGDFHGFKVPLMEEKALYETVHWVREDKNSPLPEVATEDNCNSILRSLVFYGPEKYTKFRNQVLQYRPSYRLLQYSHLRDEFLQTGTVNDPFNDLGCGTRSRKL